MESKNDTTVAAVDVLMKNETIVDDVQMENASNQDDGKAVDNVVSNHGKAVDNVVSNLRQPEIDTQILNAFMEVDPVFNPAGMDVDVEANGLCNGTRLICKRFDPNVINAEIAVGQHAGVRVLLPRIPLAPSEEDMFPFKLKRTQFPVRLSFAMTINKAQGQTIPNVGVYLPESVFSHGQLYVALSRGISRTTTKVLVKPEQEFDQRGVYTSNVVYQEVLRDE
ncbi:ATP-dependent DNA helicase PIF1-like protein [Tanacetum coccineum]